MTASVVSDARSGYSALSPARASPSQVVGSPVIDAMVAGNGRNALQPASAFGKRAQSRPRPSPDGCSFSTRLGQRAQESGEPIFKRTAGCLVLMGEDVAMFASLLLNYFA